MVFAISCIVAVAVFGYLIFMRPSHLPPPAPVSPFLHLDERKAAIYENLRDLQFEYRVGKLSDQDYQETKLELQKELAGVMAEVDRVRGTLLPTETAPSAVEKFDRPASAPLVCPSCGARFAQVLKFCGECGKPMKAGA
jgi:hypothetical protein